MMRPILVHTLSCLLLISFVQVAEVAHEFGFVPSIVMVAFRHFAKSIDDNFVVKFCLLDTINI